MPLTVSAKMMISVQASVSDATGQASQRSSARGKEASVPFQDFMNQSIASRQQFSQSNGMNAMQASDFSPEQTKNNINTVDVRTNQDFSGENSNDYISQDSPNQDDQTLPEDIGDKAAKVIEDISDGIAENVMEELDISEEDLTEVMETLGLTFMDLLNPQALNQVVEAVEEVLPDVELTADVDSIVAELIPLNEALISEALSDNGISLEEFGEYFEQVNSGEIELPDEIVQLLPTAVEENPDDPTGVIRMIVDNPAVNQDNNMVYVTDEDPAVRQTFDPMDKPVTVIKIDDDQMPLTQQTLADSSSLDSLDQDIDPADDLMAFDADAIETTVIAEDASENIVSDDIGANTMKNTGGQDDMISRLASEIVSSAADNEDENAGQSFGAGDDPASGEAAMNRMSAERNLMADAAGAAIGQQTTTFAESLAEAQAPVSPYSAQQTADIMNQIVNQASMTITETVTRMEMELNPQHLGRMIMQVAQQEGVVTARLIAQNENVRAAIETQIAQLRENLEQRGIRVDAVEVTVGTHEFERNLEEGMSQQQFEGNEEERRGDQRARNRNLNRDELDELAGDLTEEEELAAQIMRDNGGTLDYTV